MQAPAGLSGGVTRSLAAAVAVLLLVAVGAWAYRVTGPTLDELDFRTAVTTTVGEPVHVGIQLSTNRGDAPLHGVEVLGGQRGVTVTVSLADEPVDGLRGDLAAQGYALRPLRPVALHADSARATSVVVSLTPSREGVFRFRGVRLDYGSGLRAHRDVAPIAICLDTRPAGAEITAPDRCGDP